MTHWFGSQFAALHPLLQQLHRHGGNLHGTITIATGHGVAGWLGRRLARKLGLPPDRNSCGLTVTISHDQTGLHWQRHFDNGQIMTSLFTPIGNWPTGYWREETGFLHLRLTVDIIDGGWFWRPLRLAVAGVRVPLWLLPSTRAYKCVENGRYRFAVAFALPLFGEVLCYQGLLEASPAATP